MTRNTFVTKYETTWNPSIGTILVFLTAVLTPKMIRESFELDLVICFPHTDSRPSKERYISVRDALRDAGYQLKEKRVALTLQLPKNPFPVKHFHVDIVTGKAQDDSFDYIDIYDIPNNTHRRTSLKMHIDHVREVRDVIKLMKLWMRKQSLQWPTFAMEHTVIRALKNKPTNDLGACMKTVLQFIKSSILTTRLVDSANSNNHINLSEKERRQIEQAATRSFNALQQSDYWKSLV